MRIVDLFSGAGGLTFGFYYKLIGGEFVRNNRNEFVFANEYDSAAAQAFRVNYPDVNMVEDGIQNISSERIAELVGDQDVDIIIGGPPCQSFSTVGQRRYDDKAKLYNQYIRILTQIRPKMFLFENVKGILSMREIFYALDEEGNIRYEDKETVKNGVKKTRRVPVIEGYGDLIMEKLKTTFDEIGYDIEPKVLNAKNFGVPQSRERVFIVGTRKGSNLNWSFPEIVKSGQLTIKEAISDLPALNEGDSANCYTVEASNGYQLLMRKKSDSLTCHFCGEYGEKIRTVIKNVKQGQGKDDFNKLVDEGKVSEEFRLTSGYKNTYGRLVENQPSTTITNNMCTPSGLRCIHYSQDRALTPREGARIQSFPDWYQFIGTRTDVTKQIGNAVPPLLALAMARKIEKVIGE